MYLSSQLHIRTLLPWGWRSTKIWLCPVLNHLTPIHSPPAHSASVLASSIFFMLLLLNGNPGGMMRHFYTLVAKHRVWVPSLSHLHRWGEVVTIVLLRYDTINVNGHTNLRLTLNMLAPIPPDPWVSRYIHTYLEGLQLYFGNDETTLQPTNATHQLCSSPSGTFRHSCRWAHESSWASGSSRGNLT